MSPIPNTEPARGLCARHPACRLPVSGRRIRAAYGTSAGVQSVERAARRLPAARSTAFPPRDQHCCARRSGLIGGQPQRGWLEHPSRTGPLWAGWRPGRGGPEHPTHRATSRRSSRPSSSFITRQRDAGKGAVACDPSDAALLASREGHNQWCSVTSIGVRCFACFMYFSADATFRESRGRRRGRRPAPST